VKHFVELLGWQDRIQLDGIKFASIGPVTSATLREFGFPVNVEAAEYTIAGLIEALTEKL
jgi:uroporphyrinogen-III synthase